LGVRRKQSAGKKRRRGKGAKFTKDRSDQVPVFPEVSAGGKKRPNRRGKGKNGERTV